MTEHPTAQGAAPQRVEAFPWATAPTYLLRDRDAGPGEEVQRRGVHYDHRWRTHLSLALDCREVRPVHPPEQGAVVAFPEVGGPHHPYARMAA